jgi:hypothetical protein
MIQKKIPYGLKGLVQQRRMWPMCINVYTIFVVKKSRSKRFESGLDNFVELFAEKQQHFCIIRHSIVS